MRLRNLPRGSGRSVHTASAGSRPNLPLNISSPRRLPAYKHLEGRWENFLLGCVNCNSTKGDRDVKVGDLLLPDRDNTAAAYSYTMDGKIAVKAGLTPRHQEMARQTLALNRLGQASEFRNGLEREIGCHRPSNTAHGDLVDCTG